MDSHIIVSNNEAIILSEEVFQDMDMSEGDFFETGTECTANPLPIGQESQSGLPRAPNNSPDLSQQFLVNAHNIGQECHSGAPRVPNNSPDLSHQYFVNRYPVGQERNSWSPSEAQIPNSPHLNFDNRYPVGQERNSWSPSESQNFPNSTQLSFDNGQDWFRQECHSWQHREQPEGDVNPPAQYFDNGQEIGQGCYCWSLGGPQNIPNSPQQNFDNRRDWPNQAQPEIPDGASSPGLMPPLLPPPPPLIPITFVAHESGMFPIPQPIPAENPASIPREAVDRRNPEIVGMLTFLFLGLEELKATISDFCSLVRSQEGE